MKANWWRQPAKFYERYLEDFDNPDGPALIKHHPGDITSPKVYTDLNLNYLKRLGKSLGLEGIREYRRSGERFDFVWIKPGNENGIKELVLEEEWHPKPEKVREDFIKLPKANAYLKVFICGGRMSSRPHYYGDSDSFNDFVTEMVAEGKSNNPDEGYLVISIMHTMSDWLEVQGFTIDRRGKKWNQLLSRRFSIIK